jgi:3-deoxy-D-manno-octulosonic-acid transferase
MGYRIVVFLLWPVFFFYTLKVALRDKSARYLLQRLGFSYTTTNKPKTKKTYWIHCASVGEVNTYMPLHHKLIKQLPDTNFIITTNTTTGASTVARHACARTTHYYLPIESSFAIKRFLNAVKADRCFIMETEIWPLLYKHCAQRHISISIINARLSHRTLKANRWIKKIYKTSLQSVEKILCKSEQEVQNFKQLGATTKKLLNAGNLKFSPTNKADTHQAIDLNSRRYFVAASTHNDEEQQLAQLWSELNTDSVLVIVPRHPNRSKKIQMQLGKLNIKFSIRSKKQSLDNNTNIYLADTLGELMGFMAGADCVFIGGSLIPHGGQNILEAARLGKNIVCGPHMFNFKDEVALLKAHNGCIQINNTNELKNTFTQLLNSPDEQHMGENAKKALDDQVNVVDIYLSELLK